MPHDLSPTGHDRTTSPDRDLDSSDIMTPSPSRKQQKAPQVTTRIAPNPHVAFALSPNTSAAQQRQRARDSNTTPTKARASSGDTADISAAHNASGTSDEAELKDPQSLDWYIEGPGQRVGYDDFSTIDWIFEYAKERQRKRLLTATGLGGYLRGLADNSQIWIILIATGVAVGGIAAAIDIVSDWLGDLKVGVCTDISAGGRFYLNRYFCCWGLDGIVASRLTSS